MAYQFRRTLTIDKTKVPNTNQVNFPVLFSGTYSYLATVANGGKVTNASGFDIIFTSDEAGATKLDHEIESYAPTTGAVNFWVRVPTVTTATDTVIYLWYGNAAITTSQEAVTGVWDANFKGVWHLKESAGGADAIKDSTTGNHLTDTGSPTFGVAGQIDGAIQFNGSTQYLSKTSPSSVLNFNSGGWTVSFFGRVTNTAGIPVAKGAGGPANEYFFFIDANGKIKFGGHNTLNAEQNSGISATDIRNAWKHIVGLYDGTNFKILVNASQENSAASSGTLKTNQGNFFVAVQSGPTQFTAGILDELRISNIARSGDWITTEYNNQSSPSTFYAVGAEVDTSPAVVLSDQGWLSARALGPWAFIPQADKLGYINNPRWTTTPASLVFHRPCGYWYKC